MIRLELPEAATLLDVRDVGLPPDWKKSQSVTQAIGMDWLLGRSSLGLWVPSYVEAAESNLLLNPSHPQFELVTLVVEQDPFEFDPRLFR